MRAQDLIYRPGDDPDTVETGVVEQIEDVYDEYEAFDGLIEYRDNEYTDHELSEDYANGRGGPRRRPHGTRTRARPRSLHNPCLPIKFTNPSISQSRLYSSLSFIRLILTNTQVSSTLVFPDSFLQSHKFTKGNKIRMKF